MWETIKEHKWLVGGVVAVALLFVVLTSSSDAGTAPQSSVDGTDAANDYNNVLAQINGAIQQSTIAAGAKADDNQALIQIETIRAGTADNANTLAAQVAEFTTKLSADVAKNRDTLSAQVGQAQIASQTQIVQSNNLASTTNMQTLAGALVANQKTQADALVSISGNQTRATLGVAEASRPCSSYLFGLISSC
jgi:hypothetical protein